MVSRRRLTRSILVSMAVSALLGSQIAALPVAAAGPRHPNVHGRYIVVAKSHADFASARRAAIRAGATIIDEMPATDTLVVSGSVATHATIATDSSVQAVALDHLERVVPPESVGVSSFHAPKGHSGAPGNSKVKPDPAFSLKGLMWDFGRIGAQDAWKSTLGRSSVLVGVADTGLDFTHSELASKVVHVEDFTTTEDPPLCKTYFDYSDADASAEFGGPANTDWNGHGSWIGGNIAGALDGVGINGIAPKVGLVALKIAQWCGYAYDSTILASFQYAADHGINVVSISFGGYLDRSDPDQETIYQQYVKTVAYARSKGTVIAAAAGNEHVRVGAGGRVLSHGILWIPGDVPDPVSNPIDYYGLYEVPGGVPGVVDVSATGNVVVGKSASCPTGTWETSDATCKPASDAHQPSGVGRKNQLTYYSNYGPRIDVAAPGGARKFNLPNADRGGTGGFPYTDADGTTAYEDFGITSNWALQIPCWVNLGPQFYPDECYSNIQGTSMAAPHASAVLALIASAHPALAHSPSALVWLLKASADDISGNTTRALSATDTSPGDRTGIACPTGYCHLGGAADLGSRSLRGRAGRRRSRRPLALPSSHAVREPADRPALSFETTRPDRPLRRGQAPRSVRAMFTAPTASSPNPSAPISSAQAAVTGAPPTMTFTSSRRPASASAWITARWPTIVVVSRAETPTTLAPTSRTFSTKRSGATSTPRSWTSKPLAVSIIPTRFLPISWMSPLAVPMTTRPTTWRRDARASISGSRTPIAVCIARAPAIMSGRNITPQRKSSPTWWIPGTYPSSMATSGSTPSARASRASSAASSGSPSMMLWRIAANRSSFMVGASWGWVDEGVPSR